MTRLDWDVLLCRRTDSETEETIAVRSPFVLPEFRLPHLSEFGRGDTDSPVRTLAEEHRSSLIAT